MKNSMLAIAIASFFVVMGCGDSGPTSVDLDQSVSGGDFGGDTNGRMIGFGEAEKPARGIALGSGIGYNEDPTVYVGNELDEGYYAGNPTVDPIEGYYPGSPTVDPIEGYHPGNPNVDPIEGYHPGNPNVDPIEGEWSEGGLKGISWGRADDSRSAAGFELTNPTGDDSWGTGEISLETNELALRLYGLVNDPSVEYGIRVYYVNPDFDSSVIVGLGPSGEYLDRFRFSKDGKVVQGSWDDPFGAGTFVDRVEVVEYDYRGGISEEIVLTASIIWDREESGDSGSLFD